LRKSQAVRVRKLQGHHREAEEHRELQLDFGAAKFVPLCSSGMWSSTKKIKDDRTANFFQATVSGDGERFPLFVLGGSQDVYENVFEWKERQQEGS